MTFLPVGECTVGMTIKRLDSIEDAVIPLYSTHEISDLLRLPIGYGIYCNLFSMCLNTIGVYPIGCKLISLWKKWHILSCHVNSALDFPWSKLHLDISTT